MSKKHVPVLLQEVLDGLAVISGKTYIDATLGFGGHSEEIIARGGNVIGIDQDETALEAATASLGAAHKHFTAYKGNFRDINTILAGKTVDGGILADIGVSSVQLDVPERGFSFQASGPLDMRMDTQAPLTASEIVNTWEETRL
jgi:16S rRNA (cytosine1402-N4)-methyltransferase